MKNIIFIIALMLISSVGYSLEDGLSSTHRKTIFKGPVGIIGQDLYNDISIDKSVSSADINTGTAYCWNFNEIGISVTLTEECSGSSKSLTYNGDTVALGSDTSGTNVRNTFLASSSVNSSDAVFDEPLRNSFCTWVYANDPLAISDRSLSSKYTHGSPANREGWKFEIQAYVLKLVIYESGSDKQTFTSNTEVLEGWNHACFTHDQPSTNVELYLNGVDVGGGAVTVVFLPADAADFKLGINNAGTALKGKLDSPVYQPGVTWDQAQITAFYKAGLSSSLHGGLGHILTLSDEPGTSQLETDSLFLFANSSLLTNEQTSSRFCTPPCTLTNTGGAANTDGITGDDYGIELNGTTQFLTQSTMFDATNGTPAAMSIDFWFKANDGQPAIINTLFEKYITDADRIKCQLSTGGTVDCFAKGGNVGGSGIGWLTTLDNGPTEWLYFVLTWDVVNQNRMWKNGVLTDHEPNNIVVMGGGAGNDFVIGYSLNDSSKYFDGKIALFRIRDKILTQEDVEIGYITGAAHILGERGLEASLKAYEKRTFGIQHGAFDFSPYERATTDTAVFFDASSFDVNSLIKIWMEQ